MPNDDRNNLRWRSMGRLALLGVVVLALVAGLGRLAGKEVLSIERWLAELGVWGPVAFVVLMVICTALFLPDTLFAVIAGTLFGLVWGTVWTSLGAIISALLVFWISRRLLRERVVRMLEKRPKLLAIERAASREGARLQMLLRLTPIHAASLSYAMGVSRVKLGAFFLGCLAQFPVLFVEVYFGYVASHVAKLAGNVHHHSKLHLAVTLLGFVVSVVVIAYMTRLASKAIAENQDLPDEPPETRALS